MLISVVMTRTKQKRNGKLIKLNSLLVFFNMKTFRVQFVDEITAETEEDAYEILLRYLSDCAEYKDVNAFQFEEVEHKDYQTH